MGATKVILLVSTQRGLFLLESDKHRKDWQLKATPADPSWSYGYAVYDPHTELIYAAGHSAWYGPAVWRGAPAGGNWTLSSEGITYGEEGPGIGRVWNITPAHGALYAGVEPAGLFRSVDGGVNWQEVGTPLRSLPAYATWQPGKGGMPIHSILPHPSDPQQMWLAMAGGGVMYTADGGMTWEERNVRIGEGEQGLRSQKLVADAEAPERLVQQNHKGVFRSEDGGRSWRDVTAGLPTPFGFPMAMHPGTSPTFFVMPHYNDGGRRHIWDAKLAVWRSRDGGESWSSESTGLPQETAYTNVLRDCMATDRLPEPGVYFGTVSGGVYGSIDGGDTWFTLAECLPEILGLTVAIIES